MPKIKANNIHLYYERQGHGEPIVFITGFNADHHVWDGISKNFAENYDVIAVDNRGCGQSDVPDGPYSVEEMADDIIGLCDALGLMACHFIGLSMGSAITLMIAYKYPELCKSIVITNGFRKIDVRFAEFAKAQAELFAYNLPVEVKVGLNVGWGFSSGFLNQAGMLDYFIQAVKSNPMPVGEKGYRNQLAALLNFDCSTWLHQIKVPALVVGSDQDMIVPEADMKAIAETISNAEYFSFKGVGHCPQVERPREYSSLVLNFIKSIELKD